MHDRSTPAVQLQWRVVWFSLLSAGLILPTVVLSPSRTPSSWLVVAAGVVIGAAGFQVVYALRRERSAGIQRSRILWRGLTVTLCIGGGTLIALGCWTLWHRLAAT